MPLHMPLTVTLTSLLFIIYYISESIIFHRKRADAQFENKDRDSLRSLRTVIGTCYISGALVVFYVPQARSDLLVPLYAAGLGLFVCGSLLRWYSVHYLGKYFTVEVAIARDHAVIDSGPYRLIRHPSYSGLFMIWLGMGICTTNLLTLFLLVIPTGIVLMRRIAIEESALSDLPGYTDYMKRTKRLIPYIY